MATQSYVAIDPNRLDALPGGAVAEFGTTLSVALGLIGDRLGLYPGARRQRALCGQGGLPPSNFFVARISPARADFEVAQRRKASGL